MYGINLCLKMATQEQGLSRFSISDDVFVEMPIAHPKNKREQKTIGNFLTSMDTALQNETYKLTKLRTMKQSLLQKCLYNK